METKPGPNAVLLDEPESRHRLATPALIVDLDTLEENIARMAGFCEAQNISLRPHAKSHKCIEICRRQIAAGAVGICCATLGEAEVMAAGGIANILITSPVAGSTKIGRLAAVNASIPDLIAVSDHVDNVEALNAAAAAVDETLKLLVDLDIGQNRTGVTSVEAAVEIALQIDTAPFLEFAGVQAYGGHLQHIPDYAARAAAAEEASTRLYDVIEALAAAGLEPVTVTGAGTGTFEIDTKRGLYNELQAGSYVFMDVEYADDALWPDGGPLFDAALFVQTTVISANRPGQATTDAGLKAFATDGPLPTIAQGAPAGAGYKFTGDEFGCVILSPGEDLALGSVIECVAPHCDPTVNLYDNYHCVRGDTLAEIWCVDARGKY
ncbi:MAG: DSD1 family PLP-dependent enzyme [Alphaproteobacteria bacterium]|nr:DSD1 family PLP-dependent enzyme [Alphaproteobacteria bacterium]